jgi:hypothetical protein
MGLKCIYFGRRIFKFNEKKSFNFTGVRNLHHYWHIYYFMEWAFIFRGAESISCVTTDRVTSVSTLPST